MTLPVSGPISIGAVAAEFGGAAPHALSEYYAAAVGVPTSGAIKLSDFHGKTVVVPGQQQWTSASGNPYSFVVPAGVTTICAVCIGGGGSGARGAVGDSVSIGGGGGGALSYSNDIAVTPGETLAIYVGAGGTRPAVMSNGNGGGESSIRRGGVKILAAAGGKGGTWSSSSGGAGGLASAGIGAVKSSGGKGDNGDSSTAWGGGAGNYGGNGADGASSNGGTGLDGTQHGLPGWGGESRDDGDSGTGNSGGVRIIWGEGRSYPLNALSV